MPLLPSKTLDLGDRHALHAETRQSFLYAVELERFDDGLNFLHAFVPCARDSSSGTARVNRNVRAGANFFPVGESLSKFKHGWGFCCRAAAKFSFQAASSRGPELGFLILLREILLLN